MHLRERYPRIPWIIVTSVVIVDLLILATTSWLLSVRDRSTVVTKAEVLADFHSAVAGEHTMESLSRTPLPSVPPVSSTPPSTPGETISLSPAPLPGETPTPPDVSATSREAEPDVTPTPTGPPAPAGYHQPQPGVYEYATTGHESVSMLGARHDYPERTYASLQAGEGCVWRMELTIVAEHVDEWVMCSNPGTLARDWHSRTITWFDVRTNGYYDCGEPLVHDHPDMVIGRTTTYRDCTDDNGSFADLDVTLVQRAPVTVGDVSVDAIAVRIVMHSRGTTRGTTIDDYWLAASTGMILRLERMVDTTSDTKFGAVDYTERATFTLTSLQPTS